jgi:hypothetical protein
MDAAIFEKKQCRRKLHTAGRRLAPVVPDRLEQVFGRALRGRKKPGYPAR